MSNLRSILDSLIASGRIADHGAMPSQSPAPMSNFGDPPRGIFDSLTTTGLVENYGIRQKNPKRVAAALRIHAMRRRAKREAKEAAAPIAPPRRRARPGFLPIGRRRFDRAVRVMVPGRWYARGDIARATGFDRDARGDLMRAMLTRELASRAPNPDAGTGSRTCPEPEWLYRLTPKGEALRTLCGLLA
jgi:hypothetical protein